MTTADLLLIAADLMPIAGVAVLRLAWSRSRRSIGLNSLGWCAILLGLVIGGYAAGAWGVAVSALCGMATACVLLAWAGLRSTAGKQAPSRRTGVAPARGALRIGGRLLTFVLVGVIATAVSTGLAIAMRGFATAGGLGDADANAIGLMTLPIAWSLITFFLLMQDHRRGQFAVLAIASVPVLPALVPGLLA